MNRKSDKSNSATIIVAIIGVIGTFIAATITVIGNYNTEKLRQEAELTRIALVSIQTQTSTHVAVKTPTMAYATDPTLIALGTPAEPVALCDDYSFNLSTLDVTIPNGMSMMPGQEFVKTWKIKNTGECIWGDGYSLIYAYGEKMSGQPAPFGVVIAPGQEIDVSINFKAPAAIGEYTSAWQMVNPKGVVFGGKEDILFVKIIVNADGIGTFTPEVTQTIILAPTQTPNPTQTLQAAFSDIDSQFEDSLKGNIAFNKPEQMKKDETATVELILSPSLSESALATQVVERGNLVTSTAEPNVLIAPNGEKVTVTTSQIEITPRMKAVLLPQDPEAFIVTEMHDNAEQVVSSVETTAWRWSVTAKKEGSQTLELVIYQLVKYDGKEFWHEVETYKANIVVEVTLGDRVKSWNWYSIIGAVVAVVSSVLGVWKWLDERKKKAAESKPSAPVRRKK